MSQKLSCAVFDCDDVLFDACRLMLYELNLAYGTNHRFEDLGTQYALCDIFDLHGDDFGNFLADRHILERCKVSDGAGELISECFSRGHEVQALTARGWHPRGAEITTRSLLNRGITIDGVIAIPISASKVKHLEYLRARDYEIKVFVDDHPMHYEAAKAAGFNSVLMRKPWNIDYCESEHQIADSLIDVIQYL